MDTIYKTYRAEVKGTGEDGSLDMFIPVSTMAMDRDGEVVEPAAFKKTIPKFMKHPVLVSSHDYRNLTNQIGEWQKLKITDNGIEGKPKYYTGAGNEQADWAYYLASKGVAAFSIGFMPKEWEDGDGVKTPRRTYKEIELLEISQVIIPSNREAIMSMRSKSVDPVISQLIDDIVNAPIIDLTEPKEKEVTQEELIDEIDYLDSLIDKVGLSDKAKEAFKKLLKRLPADDTAVDKKDISIEDIQNIIKRQMEVK